MLNTTQYLSSRTDSLRSSAIKRFHFFFFPIFKDKSGLSITHYNLAHHKIAHAVQAKPLFSPC